MGANKQWIGEHTFRLKAEEQILAVLDLSNKTSPNQVAHEWMYPGKVAAEQVSERARRKVEQFLFVQHPGNRNRGKITGHFC